MRWFATSVFITLLGSNLICAAPPDPKKTGWLTDYAQAKAEAKRSGKPMLIVFRCEP